MNKIIEKIGTTNFYILIGLIACISIILIVLICVDRSKTKKLIKKNTEELLKEAKDERERIQQDLEINESQEIPNQMVDSQEETKNKLPENELEDTKEQEKAKLELEKIKEKLINDKEEIEGPTAFEIEQEETSIISYDELLEASGKIDLKNEQLLTDEGNEPISLEDLYAREKAKQEEINKDNEITKKIDMLDFTQEVDLETTKFRNSVVLSPVFGVINGTMKDKAKNMESITTEDLEKEIEKTEIFLKKLKELKSKLD